MTYQKDGNTYSFIDLQKITPTSGFRAMRLIIRQSVPTTVLLKYLIRLLKNRHNLIPCHKGKDTRLSVMNMSNLHGEKNALLLTDP